MKSSLLFTAIFLLAATTQAQKQSKPVLVPPEISVSLKKMFPEATEAEWTNKKEKYKAEFKIAKIKHEVWIDKTGTVSRHQYEIKKEELPNAVTETLIKEFSTYTVHDCKVNDEKGNKTYKVELKSPAGKKKANFSSDGKIILKEEN